MSAIDGLMALAIRAHRSGHRAEVIAHSQAVLRLQPQHAGALQLLSLAYLGDGQIEAAIDHATRAADAAPDDAAVHGNLGAMLLQAGRYAEALESFDKAIARRPRDADLLNSRAAALQMLGRYDEALASYDRALKTGTPHAEALHNRGLVLMKLGRPEQALASYARALTMRPDDAVLWYDRGNALFAVQRESEAVAAFERALQIRPDYCEAMNNLAYSHYRLGRYDEALDLRDRLLSIWPDYAPARQGRALSLLARGRFREGWEEYRTRQSVQDHRYLLDQNRLASDLHGRALWLRTDQGLGDELFFLRFAPELERRGAAIIYQAGCKLTELLRRSLTSIRIVDETEPVPNAATIVSIGDLPYALDMTSKDDIPPPLALSPIGERVVRWRERLAAAGPAPYLGLTWRAGAAERDALAKDIPPKELAEALKLVPATLISLQRLPQAGETAAFAAAVGRPVHDFSAVNDDLEDALALLSLLDDYVAVSNTNVHLRAGLGLPSRVLVPFPPEYRWMIEGDESPWFPATRVYRQTKNREWTGAIAQLRGDLARRRPAKDFTA